MAKKTITQNTSLFGSSERPSDKLKFDAPIVTKKVKVEVAVVSVIVEKKEDVIYVSSIKLSWKPVSLKQLKLNKAYKKPIQVIELSLSEKFKDDLKKCKLHEQFTLYELYKTLGLTPKEAQLVFDDLIYSEGYEWEK